MLHWVHVQSRKCSSVHVGAVCCYCPFLRLLLPHVSSMFAGGRLHHSVTARTGRPPGSTACMCTCAPRLTGLCEHKLRNPHIARCRLFESVSDSHGQLHSTQLH